jgi:hypothetical protein
VGWQQQEQEQAEQGGSLGRAQRFLEQDWKHGSRQTVELTVGGENRGSVTFDLDVRLKRKAERVVVAQ